MSSRCFVVNEWLIHDLAGDNGEVAQEEGSIFLSRLKENCDQIAILEGSKWMEKAYDLMKEGKLPIRILSKQLHLDILKNPQKCRILGQNDIQVLPEAERNKIPDDDIYLVELYYSANADLFITSDERLGEALSPVSHIEIRFRDDFLKEYLEK